MGDLMRRYWHPIAASAELDDSPFRTKGIRILGEDLVLYRDRSGQLGLIARYCPHRRVDLAIGVVEQDGLRCQYHGWKFDANGTVRGAAVRRHDPSRGQLPRQVRHRPAYPTVRDRRPGLRLPGPASRRQLSAMGTA